MITETLRKLAEAWLSSEPDDLAIVAAMHDACEEAGYPRIASHTFNTLNKSSPFYCEKTGKFRKNKWQKSSAIPGMVSDAIFAICMNDADLLDVIESEQMDEYYHRMMANGMICGRTESRQDLEVRRRSFLSRMRP